MAYARFGRDSDVYVYEDSDGGFTCCRCSLSPQDRRGHYGWTNVPTLDEMLAHLEEHSAAGHKVPPSALEEIRSETG